MNDSFRGNLLSKYLSQELETAPWRVMLSVTNVESFGNSVYAWLGFMKFIQIQFVWFLALSFIRISLLRKVSSLKSWATNLFVLTDDRAFQVLGTSIGELLPWFAECCSQWLTKLSNFGRCSAIVEHLLQSSQHGNKLFFWRRSNYVINEHPARSFISWIDENICHSGSKVLEHMTCTKQMHRIRRDSFECFHHKQSFMKTGFVSGQFFDVLWSKNIIWTSSIFEVTVVWEKQ